MAGTRMCVLVMAMSLGMMQASRQAAQLQSFASFVQKHGRAYQQGSAEYASRQAIYEKRLAASQQHNSQANRSWTAGVNRFWDWTESETMSLRGWDGSMSPAGGSQRSVKPHTAFLQQKMDLPAEKLWTDLAAAKAVKNQGSCGSCWAVSSATVLAAHVEIYTKQVRSFSAEQIVHCTANPKHCGGDGGCKGATAELAMDYVLKHGCATEEDVPYTGTDGMCTSGSASDDMSSLLDSGSSLIQTYAGNSFGMTGWETLPKNEYEPLVRALAERGPVAVSVAADQWFNYESGIFNGCGKDNVIDHAVTAVGYGEENGQKYWTIQNSWGDWGENGRIRLERHSEGGYCGMNNDPQKGIACQGETAPVPVCGMCGVLFDSVVPHFS